jgi:hypothetical protein
MSRAGTHREEPDAQGKKETPSVKAVLRTHEIERTGFPCCLQGKMPHIYDN